MYKIIYSNIVDKNKPESMDIVRANIGGDSDEPAAGDAPAVSIAMSDSPVVCETTLDNSDILNRCQVMLELCNLKDENCDC